LPRIIKGIKGKKASGKRPTVKAIKLGKNATRAAFLKPKKQAEMKRTALTSEPVINWFLTSGAKAAIETNITNRLIATKS